MNVKTALPPPLNLASLARLGGVVAAVVAAHGAGLWALQHLKLQRPAQAITPPEMVVQVTLAPSPAPSPPVADVVPAVVPVAAPAPTPRQAVTKPDPLPTRPSAQPLPAPAPVAEPTEAAVQPLQPAASPAPAVASANSAANLAPNAAATPSPRPAPAASPAPPRIELPSSQAEYLNNPPPAYPRLSRRLGEQGKVVVRVLIGADGKAEQAQVLTSSGYDRLDQTALTTVLGWRYVPGRRNGVAEAMWFNVPIQFVLE